MAKMTATEGAQHVIDAAVQLHGARGVQSGTVVERLYREIRALRIYEGATEVQKLIVGRAALAGSSRPEIYARTARGRACLRSASTSHGVSGRAKR